MKMRNKVISLLIIAVMMFNGLGSFIGEAFGVILTRTARAEVAEIQEVFSLQFSEFGEEEEYDEWSYALRETDGYAVITGYMGKANNILTIPQYVNGIAVVGIGDNALADIEIDKIAVHGNIMYIADNAFGDRKPEIQALTGSYALYYASQNGFDYNVPTDYELVADVIDYTDSVQGSVTRRGDQYVCLDKLEGMRLNVGSIFFFEDARGTDFFYRVLALTNEGENVIATVEIPEISETFIEAHVQETYYFTADDFTPADGVVVESSNVHSRAMTTDVVRNSIPFNYSPGSYGGDISLGVSGNITGSTTYNVDIVNGELIYISTEEDITHTVSATVSTKAATPQATAAPGEKPQESDLGPVHVEQSLGKLHLSCGYFALDFNVKFGAEVSGSVTVSLSSTTTQKKVYDFDQETWIVEKSNGNAKRTDNGFAVKASINGKAYVSVSGTLAVFELVNVAQISIEAGVRLTTNITFVNTAANAVPCTDLELAFYIKLDVYIGVWHDFGKVKGGNLTLGGKYKIYGREFTHNDLFGIPACKLHFSFTFPMHEASNCPYSDRCEIVFDTKTSYQITSAYVFKGESVPFRSEYNLTEVTGYGKFLGWATSPELTYANWGFDSEYYLVEESMTLYAVWENAEEIIFDSMGGSSVKTQYVPEGGYIVPPEEPTKKDVAFLYWYTLDDYQQAVAWKFEEDTVPNGGITLYARWSEGEVITSGTSYATHIGNPADINLDNYKETQTSKEYFNYQLMRDVDGNLIGVNITGVKNNPVNLVVPSELKVNVGVDSQGIVLFQTLKVVNIYTSAFRNCDTLKSVVFNLDIGVDTERMFEGCDSLEYVDFSKTQMKVRNDDGVYVGMLQDGAFKNCPALKAVKLPAGIQSIGNSAFYGCKSLTSLNIDSGIISIGNSAFYGCESLTKVNLNYEKAQVRRILRKAVRTGVYLIVPIMFGLAAVAESVVRLLLTEKWLPCVVYMQWICLGEAAVPIISSNLIAIKASGRSDIYMRLELVRRIVMLTILMISVFVFDSVQAIAVSFALCYWLDAFIVSVPVRKLLDYGFVQQMADIWKSILAAAVMFVVVFSMHWLKWPVFVLLLSQIIVGVVVYLLICFCIKVETQADLVRLVGNMIQKNK